MTLTKEELKLRAHNRYLANRETVLERTRKQMQKRRGDPTKCPTCGKLRTSKKYKLCDSCREHSREYYHKNRERQLVQMKEWRARNHNHLQLQRHEHHIANRERLCALSREWAKNNPIKRRLNEHNRRARVKGNGGTFTFKELNEQFERQEGFCNYCGGLLYASFDNDVHIDHMTPISRGGSNDISNIVLSCAPCNLKKGSKTAEEFLQVIS
jgi:hypothetical protein